MYRDADDARTCPRILKSLLHIITTRIWPLYEFQSKYRGTHLILTRMMLDIIKDWGLLINILMLSNPQKGRKPITQLVLYPDSSVLYSVLYGVLCRALLFRVI